MKAISCKLTCILNSTLGYLYIYMYDSFLPEVHPLVMAKLSIGHVSMVPDDLADMLRWHVFLLCIHKAKLSLF